MASEARVTAIQFTDVDHADNDDSDNGDDSEVRNEDDVVIWQL